MRRLFLHSLACGAVCGFVTGVALITTIVGASEVQAQTPVVDTQSWEEVFRYGFVRVDDIVSGPRRHWQFEYGHECGVGVPDSVTLISQKEYPRTWIPSLKGNDVLIRLPTSPDTLRVGVVGTWCTLTGDLGMFVLSHAGRFAPLEVHTDHRLRMLILFRDDTDGRLSELRWSPELKEAESLSQARSRWRKKRWTNRDVDAVLAGNIYVGMSSEMVRESWGMPRRVNRTTTSNSQREQWVYEGSNYVYIENGRVIAIQN